MNTWENLCGKTITRFGGAQPGAELEAEIMAAWQQDPKRVEGAIERTAALFKAGTIHSGWGILRNELAKQGPERRRKAKAINQWDQDADLATAEVQLEQRATEFRDGNRCPECLHVKLPWWVRCEYRVCAERRRAQEAT